MNRRERVKWVQVRSEVVEEVLNECIEYARTSTASVAIANELKSLKALTIAKLRTLAREASGLSSKVANHGE